jgi:hypothetical protein
LAGCPSTGVNCSKYLTACGTTCADIKTDPNNCGGCGLACQPSQLCQAGAGLDGAPGCVCEPGTTSCNGGCVVTSSDPNHCGSCQDACSSGQVCENGSCQTACNISGQNLCTASGGAGFCADFMSDSQHCGSCSNACAPNQSCHNGSCRYDLMAACASTAELAGISAQSLVSTRASVGQSPQALGVYSGTLLDLDAMSGAGPGQINEVDLVTLKQFTEAPLTDANPTALSVDGQNVYIASGPDGGAPSLQVLQVFGAGGDAGNFVTAPLDGGLGLTRIASAALAGGGAPQAIAKLGTSAFVTLLGSGQVAQLDVSNPAQPSLTQTYDLNGLSLNPFSGGTSPAPRGIAVFQNRVYVALGNQNLSTQALGGDGGLLAVLNPVDGGVSEVDLGSDVCVVPSGLLPSADGKLLFVTCAGQATTSGAPNHNTLSVDRAAVVAMSTSNQRVGFWQCPQGGPDSGCNTFSPSSAAQRGSQLFVSDSAYGRMLVLSADGALAEVAGFQDGGSPPLVCPPSGVTGNGNIRAILSVP